MARRVLFASLLSLFILTILTGCASRNYPKAEPALIVIKSKGLKYADLGFIYRGENLVKVQVYSSGAPIFRLSVGEMVCVDGRCLSETEFYRKYLGVEYPKGTLFNILSKKPIFGTKELEKESDRSAQRIKVPERFDIIYTFDSGSVRFKDRRNGVMIKITER